MDFFVQLLFQFLLFQLNHLLRSGIQPEIKKDAGQSNRHPDYQGPRVPSLLKHHFDSPCSNASCALQMIQ